MDSIASPAFILSVVLMIIGLLFANRFSAIGEKIIAVTSSFPTTLRHAIRRRNWKMKRRLYRIAANPLAITNHIIRSYALLIIFAATSITYIALSNGPLNQLNALPFSIQLLVYSPMLCLEILWLNQRDHSRFLIYISGRITSRQAQLPTHRWLQVKRARKDII